MDKKFWVQASQFFCMCSQFVYTYTCPGFFLEIGQWGSSGPPSVILGGPFLRKGVQERGSHKTEKVFELIGTDFTMRKRTLIYVLPPFWNILGNWKNQGSNDCRIPDICLVNNDSNEEEKGNWDSKRLSK